MPTIRRVLVPVDFSDTAKHALAYGADIAKNFGAELELLHVYQLPMVTLPDGAVLASAEYISRLTASIQTELDRLAATAKELGVSVKTKLLEGAPHECIVKTATDGKADMIVIGTHGRTGLTRLLLGSVAERVVRTAECPVLTVHAPSA